MWVKSIKMCFLELAVRKISDCYLKPPKKRTPIVPHFSWINFKNIIINFKNISKSCCHKDEVGQNNWQRIGLLFFILSHKKKIRGHETLTIHLHKELKTK